MIISSVYFIWIILPIFLQQQRPIAHYVLSSWYVNGVPTSCWGVELIFIWARQLPIFLFYRPYPRISLCLWHRRFFNLFALKCVQTSHISYLRSNLWDAIKCLYFVTKFMIQLFRRTAPSSSSCCCCCPVYTCTWPHRWFSGCVFNLAWPCRNCWLSLQISANNCCLYELYFLLPLDMPSLRSCVKLCFNFVCLQFVVRL